MRICIMESMKLIIKPCPVIRWRKRWILYLNFKRKAINPNLHNVHYKNQTEERPAISDGLAQIPVVSQGHNVLNNGFKMAKTEKDHYKKSNVESIPFTTYEGDKARNLASLFQNQQNLWRMWIVEPQTIGLQVRPCQNNGWLLDLKTFSPHI